MEIRESQKIMGFVIKRDIEIFGRHHRRDDLMDLRVEVIQGTGGFGCDGDLVAGFLESLQLLLLGDVADVALNDLCLAYLIGVADKFHMHQTPIFCLDR